MGDPRKWFLFLGSVYPNSECPVRLSNEWRRRCLGFLCYAGCRVSSSIYYMFPIWYSIDCSFSFWFTPCWARCITDMSFSFVALIRYPNSQLRAWNIMHAKQQTGSKISYLPTTLVALDKFYPTILEEQELPILLAITAKLVENSTSTKTTLLSDLRCLPRVCHLDQARIQSLTMHRCRLKFSNPNLPPKLHPKHHIINYLPRDVLILTTEVPLRKSDFCLNMMKRANQKTNPLQSHPQQHPCMLKTQQVLPHDWTAETRPAKVEALVKTASGYDELFFYMDLALNIPLPYRVVSRVGLIPNSSSYVSVVSDDTNTWSLLNEFTLGSWSVYSHQTLRSSDSDGGLHLTNLIYPDMIHVLWISLFWVRSIDTSFD